MNFFVLAVAVAIALCGCKKTLSNEIEWTLDNSPSSENKGTFSCKFSSSRACHISIKDSSSEELLAIAVDSGSKAKLTIPDSAKFIRVTAYPTDKAKEIGFLPGKISQESKARISP